MTKTTPTPDAAADVALINERQMRQLHALLRNHGITGDVGVHDYLSTALAREVESRRTVTQAEAAELIAHLDREPAGGPTVELLAALRAPFPEEAIGKLPKSTCRDCSQSQRKRCDQHKWVSRCRVCNGSHTEASIHIDYVGHGDVTARLLQVDPLWSWRPFTAEEAMALPPVLREAGLWIHLTVGGVTRPGFGDADGKKGGNAVKECIGDAIRNAAMRFGVALELWIKGDRDWMHEEKHDNEPGQSPGSLDVPQPPVAPAHVRPARVLERTDNPGSLAATAELIAELEALAGAQTPPRDLEWITKKLRADGGNLAVADLYTLAPEPLAELVDRWQQAAAK